MGRVIGFHIIACTYGFWLPNDERGSGSDFVRAEALTKFGPANPVSHGRSVARKAFNYEIREMAREALMYPVVRFNDRQLAAVGRGIAEEISQFGAASVHAYAQLRNHFHLVCGPCRYDVRRFAGRLKGAGAKALIAEEIHPFQKFADERGEVPSCWSVKPWVVYLFSTEDMVRSIRYTRDNLAREKLAVQEYAFVTPFGEYSQDR